MKKGILLVVFCALTTFSFAQKKGKVAKQAELEQDVITYVVLQVIEIPNFESMNDLQQKEFANNPELQMKMAVEMTGESTFEYNLLDQSGEDARVLQQGVSRAQDISAALNVFGSMGYELKTANVIDKSGLVVHYFVFGKGNK